MGYTLDECHRCNQTLIIREWVERLDRLYQRKRSQEELIQTCSEAFEANYRLIAHEDYGPIDHFINKITRMRLGAGFLLSDVQKAFEQYRIIIIPILAREGNPEELLENIQKINRCLSYTIHRFSDHFQNMHEKMILEHNRRLEEEVRARTAALRESELKYRTLVEEIIDGYFVVQDAKIVFANQAFCEMHGSSLAEIVGEQYSSFVAPEDRPRVIESHSQSFDQRTSPRSFEYQRLCRDGRKFPTEILARAARYEGRLALIGICRDITERIQMEDKVREAERMAYIGQLTTSLSHELRNPLSSVKMNLQILKKNDKIQGNDQRRVDISVREVGRLEHILKELLDFAKPVRFSFGPVDIKAVLDSCLEAVDMKLSEKGLYLQQEIANELPLIFADREKLEQVFMNLLLNAIEACSQQQQIWISSKKRLDGQQAWIDISVIDSGTGIAESLKNSLFEPFVTSKSKGTGLGLSNVKQIVEAHGGVVRAENLKPCGASFTVTLPQG
ncbi:MAG: PAS domain S-box protein [Desulfohalobiaceae bacterium]|nr:PAS domain S-box protein [Desulfohalobiaceae bacterium]